MNKLHLYLANLDHNFGLIRKQLSSNTAIFGVVKAWAYGSDMIKIAKRLEQIGVDYLAVAYAEEGKILRKGGVNIPILVFYPQIKGLQTIIDYKLEPSLYSTLLLEKFRCILKEKKSKHRYKGITSLQLQCGRTFKKETRAQALDMIKICKI